MKRAILTGFLLGLLIGGLVTGCGDEECNCPPCAYRELPDPALDNIWPNEDGTWWLYEYTNRVWEWSGWTYYPESSSVPPIPSLDQLASLVDCNEIGVNPEIVRGTYQLEFDGEITTETGVTAQNLTETIDTGEEKKAILGWVPNSVFFARLALARPDLREKINDLGVFGDEGLVSAGRQIQGGVARRADLSEAYLLKAVREPYFIHGYAWEKTQEWIGTYGDLDTLLAWKFLESNLEPCHEFSHQLIPELADDVFLHCRVLRKSIFETEAGIFDNVVECLYVIDYGVWMATDEGGEILGWSRTFDYGMVMYAPTVGPICDYERVMVSVGDTDFMGVGDVTVSLMASNTIRN